jgi:hypothetical protein
MAAVGVFAALLAQPQSAAGQNLVQDPNFGNGLDDYSPNYNATPTTMNGMTGVDLFDPNGGAAYVEQYPLSSAYSAGTTYIFTFLAAALNSAAPTELIASFGPNCVGDCENTSLDQTISNTGLTQYTFSATAQDSGSVSYLYVETDGGAGAFVTGLDLEPAPAPIPGGGLMSFGALAAGLTVYGVRRKQSA